MKCPSCQTENLPDSRFCHKCATPLEKEPQPPFSFTKTMQTPFAELSRGSLFAGRYEVIEMLGRGGMGKVYKVYDRKVNEAVALKILKPEIGFNEKAVERLKNELRYARKISHRNVCRMYDLGTEEMTHFITMEYVEGEDLKAFMSRAGQLTIGKVLRIVRQVCEGLVEAHRIGVVHRDLKPQNIMIDKEGNVRIMDFGLARSLETEGLTGSGVMLGTPEYMSPEQVDLKEVDRRSDIYSLGIILYEMLAGKMPFEGETPLSLAMKHKSEKPKDVRELNPLLPAGLSRLVMNCLEKDRERRYQSVHELLADLARSEKEIPSVERVTPRKEPLSTREITVTFRLRKMLLPALSVLVLIIAGILILRSVIVRKEISSQDQISSTERSGPMASPGGKEAVPGQPRADILGRLGNEISKFMSKDLADVKDTE
ncbi:MAG: serine/threonine-protein kinase [Candidatus Aminicenantales bacterium]